MRVLILGCGYLGRRVATLLHGRGDEVHAATRSEATAAGFRALGWRPVLCDVLSPPSLRGLPAVDAVVYAVGWDRSSGAGMRQVYVEGLTRVLENLTKTGKFVHVSSTSVYGQNDGGWVDENSPTEPAEESGRIVLEAEQTLRRARPDAVILRFAGIYGPGRLLRQKAVAAGEAIAGAADRWLNLIHVDDGAAAVVAALDKAPPGATVNVCDGRPATRLEFFTELARVLHAPAPRFVAPPGDAPAPPHELAQRRIGNRRMLEQLRVSLNFPNFQAGLQYATISP